jgi:hypothetical protein
MKSATESRLARIRIEPRAGQVDSLVACLEAILRALGREISYDELLGLTEIGQRNSADSGGVTDAKQSSLHGRHDFLRECARKYGIEIRELHPPDAAPQPPAPQEFEWHFRDSYLPFVRTAIERDEPVLAWMGWPPPHESDWGIITAVDPATGGCTGWTFGGPRSLESAPVQVYLISPARG